MAKKSTLYSKQFKHDAVAMTEVEGVSVTEVAKQLGIRPKTLYAWRDSVRKEGDKAFPGSGTRTPEEDELRQLRREVRQLKMEREILKKAMRVIVGE